ncbi:hypothetical protein, partial [Streptomyces sp. NPDC058953]|uniref:hypothetical protein n=1 Tax=Streptomyces sp. NPDC058953 TaxID=3346676 RepID=UPI0036A0344A
MPSQSSSHDRLARLRGSADPQPYTTTKITALTANPACGRRSVLDAAGVDKAALAQRVGHQARFGRSPFAIARGTAFEALVKWGGHAELIRLLREELGVPVAEAAVEDLSEVGGNPSPILRERETRRVLARLARDGDERLILDRPVLTLEVAGRTAYLEPDTVTHRAGGLFHLVCVKSFAAIDGQASPSQVAAAAKQAAVYVLALRGAFERAGIDPAQIADRFLLVCPKDFSNRPYGRLVDLRQELDALRFQLDRLPRAAEIARDLPADATFDTTADPDVLHRSLDALDAAYAPECLSFCELARFCRREAEECGAPARLGGSLRGALPGIDSLHTAVAHLDGTALTDDSTARTVALLLSLINN